MMNATSAEDFDKLIEKNASDEGKKIAQIFSGIFFGGLAAWLSISNGGSLAFVQRASLEKRLTVCCFINTYVAMFSTFFNIFQLSELQTIILPVHGGYNFDLCRPIEWVCTCPLMQLSLVLMGGAKLPDYRRYLMPIFSISILICGTTSTLMTIIGLKVLAYILGLMLFVTMCSFNRLQIMEYSGGAEGFTMGDSEFRKATLLLLSTWVPFPTWFALSTEGFGVINNALVIHVGWSFLNILAKFTFIFYIQRIKDLYCNRLKTKREMNGSGKKMYGLGPSGGMHGSMSPPDFEMGGQMMMPGSAQAYEMAEDEKKREKLTAVVIETMTFLGMAQNTDRFVRLLEKAEVTSIQDVEVLNQVKCETLSLPWELVTALQKRVNVWKMDMVDDADLKLERGEEFYLKKFLENPAIKDHSIYGADQAMPNMIPYGQQEYHMQMKGESALGGGGVGISAVELEDMLQKMEDRILGNQMQQLDQRPLPANGHVQEFMAAFYDKMQATIASAEERLAQRIEATSKTAEYRAELRSFENRMNLKLDTKAREQREDLVAFESRILAQVEQKVGNISTIVDTCCQKVDLCFKKIESSSTEVACKVSEKLDAQIKSLIDMLLSAKDSQSKTSTEAEVAWRQRLDELENAMICRHDEQEAVLKKRNEELIRHSAAKRIEEVASQVKHASESATSTSRESDETIVKELGSLAMKLTMKLEAMHVASTKHQAEMDHALQRSRESIAQQMSIVMEQAVTDTAKKVSAETVTRTEKSIEQLDSSLSKRFQTAVEHAVAQGAQNGSNGATHKVEKVLGDWESSQRAEVKAQTSSILQSIEEFQSSQLRIQGERLGSQNKRLEEIVEISMNRNVQKTEDVGLEIKKELHGFAKRLNTKIPFM